MHVIVIKIEFWETCQQENEFIWKSWNKRVSLVNIVKYLDQVCINGDISFDNFKGDWLVGCKQS